MFDLGMGQWLVGITNYCVHPAHEVKNLPKVGGTKTARLERILRLNPDLVLANQEENSRELVENLRVKGVPVWLTFPKNIRDSLSDLWLLAQIFHSDVAVKKLQILERSIEWAQLSREDHQSVRYFCPIWQGTSKTGQLYWMTFNKHTYMHDVLDLLGGKNIFADRTRKFPLLADLGMLTPEESPGHDDRYPRVTPAEIQDLEPEVIILPDEPYAFAESDRIRIREILPNTPAVQNDRVYLIEGSLITWPGTRLAKALDQLSDLFFRT
jgi:ABC-type Fe3+-hydroxamate transport system substrate-binding protein